MYRKDQTMKRSFAFVGVISLVFLVLASVLSPTVEAEEVDTEGLLSNFARPERIIITVAIIVAMLMLNMINEYIDNYAVRFVIDWFCFMSRFSNFVYGMLDPAALVYYLSIAGVFLFLTVRVYDKRRWG
jgi:hypothetical protein